MVESWNLVRGRVPLFKSASISMCVPRGPRHTPQPASLWLFSRRADFWLACGGASIGLLAAMLLIFLRGDREIDAIDFVLSEFHLGATYDAVLRRRLWHHRQFDVLLMPLVILAADLCSFAGRANGLAHVDRHVRCRLAPRPAESGSGALLPARHGRAGVADP